MFSAAGGTAAVVVVVAAVAAAVVGYPQMGSQSGSALGTEAWEEGGEGAGPRDF